MSLSFLVHPLARDLDIDSPSTTYLRRRILHDKAFLRRIYEEWYGAILSALPPGAGKVLEIGTGAGFLSEHLPDLITSEIFAIPGLDLVLDSCRLPFASESLRAIVMTDVFHHIPNACLFLNEAAACVRPGGAIIMIEPWNSTWSRWVYKNLHHEPYHPEAERWEFPSTGPLSGANGALPWIVFERDQARFLVQHAQWRIESISLMMPFRYLFSGGVTYRSLMPGWTVPLWRMIELALQPFARHLAMFARIVLKRAEDTHAPSLTSPILPQSD
jgi:SAM-dependent methyltransferase